MISSMISCHGTCLLGMAGMAGMAFFGSSAEAWMMTGCPTTILLGTTKHGDLSGFFDGRNVEKMRRFEMGQTSRIRCFFGENDDKLLDLGVSS